MTNPQPVSDDELEAIINREDVFRWSERERRGFDILGQSREYRMAWELRNLRHQLEASLQDPNPVPDAKGEHGQVRTEEDEPAICPGCGRTERGCRCDEPFGGDVSLPTPEQIQHARSWGYDL